MIELTDLEKFKVKEIRNDPVLMGILHKISEHYGAIPTYNPKPAEDTDQFERWVYRSGINRGVQISLQALGYTNDRQSD